MTTNDKNVTLEDQVQADKLEGIEHVDKDTADLIKRYNELAKRKKAIENEQDAIKDLIRELMFEKHAKKITFNGMDLASLTHTTSRSFDYKSAESELGVEVVAKYTKTKESTRLDIKK